MGNILLATVGSLGDLHPLLAIGTALSRTGNSVAIAANPMHREIAQSHQLKFIPIGNVADPTLLPFASAASAQHDDMLNYMEHCIFRQFDALFEDLHAATERAQVVVAPYFLVPAYLVAEKRGIPFVGCTLSPAYLVSQTSIRRKIPAHWHFSVAAIRRRHGLHGKKLPHTPTLTSAAATIGLFPRFMMPRAPGVTPGIRIVGYPNLTRMSGFVPDPPLQSFCDERTVVFSFGSYADRGNARHLYLESVAACRTLGLKCVYLSRYVEASAAREEPRDAVLLRSFLPHDAVFPLAGLIVHHGGAGTLMAACRSAKPMVIAPFGYDQPYHAQRMSDLAGCPTIPAGMYDRGALVPAIERLVGCRDSMQQLLVTLMAQEQDGASHAADEILTRMKTG